MSTICLPCHLSKQEREIYQFNNSKSSLEIQQYVLSSLQHVLHLEHLYTKSSRTPFIHTEFDSSTITFGVSSTLKVNSKSGLEGRSISRTFQIFFSVELHLLQKLDCPLPLDRNNLCIHNYPYGIFFENTVTICLVNYETSNFRG